jgi:hypothetical protein
MQHIAQAADQLVTVVVTLAFATDSPSEMCHLRIGCCPGPFSPAVGSSVGTHPQPLHLHLHLHRTRTCCCCSSRITCAAGGAIALEPGKDASFTGSFHVDRIAHMVLCAEVPACSAAAAAAHPPPRSCSAAPTVLKSRRVRPTSCRCPTCCSRCRPPPALCAPPGPSSVPPSCGGSQPPCRCILSASRRSVGRASGAPPSPPASCCRRLKSLTRRSVECVTEQQLLLVASSWGGVTLGIAFTLMQGGGGGGMFVYQAQVWIFVLYCFESFAFVRFCIILVTHLRHKFTMYLIPISTS